MRIEHMTSIRRASIVVVSFLVLSMTVNACGVWRGSSDVNTDTGEGAIGKGPGLFTGKRGGVVIYQQ